MDGQDLNVVPGRPHGVREQDADVVPTAAGCRIFERTAAGLEHEWGEVVAWEPPSRFVYLWHLRRDRADATAIQVRPMVPGEDACFELFGLWD